MKWMRTALIAVAVLAFMPLGALCADIPSDVPERVRFFIGGMGADVYTDAGLGSTEAGIGASINFEDIFDLPENDDVWRFEVNWHVAKRQFIDLGYFSLNRSGSKILEDDIEWGDYVYKAGGKVTATFDTEFPYAAWRYSFLDLPQVRISGSAGISYIGIAADLVAGGSVTDMNGDPVTGSIDGDVSIAAPVPIFGLQLDWMLTKRLAVLLYIRQIYISNVAGIDGGIGESAARITWWYAKHAGISGGLDKEDIDLKSYESGDTKARFRYAVRSWSLYLTFAF